MMLSDKMVHRASAVEGLAFGHRPELGPRCFQRSIHERAGLSIATVLGRGSRLWANTTIRVCPDGFFGLFLDSPGAIGKKTWYEIGQGFGTPTSPPSLECLNTAPNLRVERTEGSHSTLRLMSKGHCFADRELAIYEDQGRCGFWTFGLVVWE